MEPWSMLAAGWLVALPAAVVAVGLRARLDRMRATVAVAAHEIRGPLHTALLALDAGAPGAVVGLELRRAGRAVADLDAAPWRRAGELRCEAVDVAALVREAAPAWRALGDVRADAGGEAWLRGDGVRLAQAIGNLVANAAEHGSGGACVRVSRGRASVRVTVADDGPGLPASLAALLAREGAGRRGHGLGVAARVARAHGGRLVEEPAERGARLTLDLPVAGPPQRRVRAIGGSR